MSRHAVHREAKVYLMCMQLLYVPGFILVVPNIRHRRLRPELHLANCPPISQEGEDVVRIGVGDLVVLVPWPFEELQMMQQTSRPDVDSAVPLIVLVPRLAFFGPYTGLLELSACIPGLV